jgi:Sortase domain
MLKGRSVPVFRITLILLVAALAAAGALRSNAPQPVEAAGALLHFPATDCSGSTQVTFNWLPVEGATEQWLDLSVYDNHFIPGTYRPIKLTPGVDTLTTDTLNSESPHFWRINSKTPDGWVESTLGQFMPCGGPLLLWGPITCQSSELAAVDFNWAPRADALGYQYLELSSDVNFGNLVRVGPLAAAAQNYHRGGFKIGERTFFRIVWEAFDGTRVMTKTASFVPECTTPSINSALYYSPDRLVSTSMGINAPVNVRDVGFDGFLGNPSGAYDVVRYNFAGLPNLRAYPGDGGVTMIGGHVDYYVVGLAIFAPLRSAQPGQSIEYQRGDGVVIKYVVDWVKDVPFNQSLNSYLHSKGRDELILITCNGTFDPTVHRYDLRRLVHAIRVN